ncbi:MAG: HXXEE domain-containing protein [Bacteroidota bacterium]
MNHKENEIKKILWLIPIVLTIHNIEEALTMPEWMNLYVGIVKQQVPFMSHLQFSARQLYISLVLVTIVPAVVTWFCLRGEIRTNGILALLTLQAIIFWNALIPHMIGWFFLGMYNPGTMTAVIFNIPFSFYLFYQIRRSGIVPEKLIVRSIGMGLVIYLPLVYLNHLLAHTIANII